MPKVGVAKLASFGILLVALCAAPFVFPAYFVFQLTFVLIYAIAILGLNLLTGFNGQISIGHGAFFAIGAYVAAALMDHYDFPYWSTLPAAAGVCLVFGFLFGIPALRLEGHYLALATFALAVAMPQLLKFKGIEYWTGGVQGIVLLKPEPPRILPINDDQWLYFLTLGIALVAFWLAWNLVRGRLGRAMIAIRDNALAASTMGVDVALTKSIVFGVSAAYTGLAGALSALLVQLVAPDTFSVFLSITLLVGVVVGGLATISGAIYGAIFIQFIPNLADQISKSAPWAIYGLFLIAFMYVMPNGVAGLIEQLRKRLSGQQRAGHARTPANNALAPSANSDFLSAGATRVSTTQHNEARVAIGRTDRE